MRKVFGAVCGLLSLFSMLFVFAAIDDIIAGDSGTDTGILIGLLVFFSGVSASLAYAARSLWRGATFDVTAMETPLLTLAAQRGGRLTLAEAAIGLKVPIAQAREALDHLVTQGAADTNVADSGELVYVVGGLLTAADKAGAIGVLAPRRSQD
jgi:hypothetical protein